MDDNRIVDDSKKLMEALSILAIVWELMAKLPFSREKVLGADLYARYKAIIGEE